MKQIKTLITACICYIMSMGVLSAQCDNTAQYPASTINIVCGSNTITEFIFAGEYSVTTGYLDQATLVYTSSVATDYITIRKASDNAVVAHGPSPLTATYLPTYGNLEVHINTNTACGTESVNRILSCVMTCRCDNSGQWPPNAVNMVCGSTTITNLVNAGEYSLTSGYQDQATLVYSSSVASDYITIRKRIGNAVVAHGPSPLTMMYLASYDSLEIHINTNVACGTENVNRTISCAMTCGCNNTFYYPENIISLSEGTNTIATNQYAGDFNVTTGYIDGASIKYASSTVGDYITLRRASDNFIIASGVTPLAISYQASMGNIEMHINTNASCGTQVQDRTTTISMYNLYKGGNDDGFTTNGASEADNPLLTSFYKGGIDDGFANISYEQCSGSNRRWLGTFSNIWEVALNWECNVLPEITSDVDVPSGLALYPQVSTSHVIINSITMKPGSTLTINTPWSLSLND